MSNTTTCFIEYNDKKQQQLTIANNLLEYILNNQSTAIFACGDKKLTIRRILIDVKTNTVLIVVNE